ncbi:MAG TPA: SGNH/GDSL hydrolase family protein [Phycisphaerae bacterium]|nr:SGNH/GDSL hydrolase family protein [Phycisphaerae bacterium]HRW54649.1 SGNH/GDSL hydrolase family protein [Phycisphaerae bacterium]
MPRRILAAVALFALIATILTTANADTPANKGKPAPDPKRFAREIDDFKLWDRKNVWPDNGVLFAGSSSIRIWMTRESFPDLPVINRGFGGAEIPDMLHYYDNVIKPYNPRVIVFYCGDNDIADGRSVKQVVDDFTTFLGRVHKDFPKAHLIYIPAKPSVARWNLWPQMHDANSQIKQMAETDKLLTFADTDVVLLGDDGKPMKDLFMNDGLHLNDAGYRKWTAVVTPLIKATMKE